MELDELKRRLADAEGRLDAEPFVELASFERDGAPLRLAVTARLRRQCRKEGVWRSREMLATLKNAAYGFEPSRARSAGGRDGLFLLDRDFAPPNEMMRKLFDRYLDRPGSGAEEVALALGAPAGELLPVRLVSQHLRLLGVLHRAPDGDRLVLVDCDRSE